MTRVVTALYDSHPQAELALAHLNSEVGVEEGEIVDRSVAGRTRLARMSLNADEQTACSRELEAGGYLLIARISKEHDSDHIVRLLREVPRDGLGKGSDFAEAATTRSEGFRVEDPRAPQASRAPAAPPQAPVAARAPAAPAPQRAPAPARGRVGTFEGFRVEDPAAQPPPQAPVASTAQVPAQNQPAQSQPPQSRPAESELAEERIPLVEEELRIGKREVVRGGARVHAHLVEHPVREEVELLAEHTSIERRPATRQLSEEELEQGGLLRERVIEISEMREEAVVSKEAFVREELLVKKTVERRTEVVEETVRRTEVEAERLPGAESRPALSGFATADHQGSGHR
ncbi:MAG: hypothetical protein AVDCRST_MAG23-1056 [uncultured Sphingosinicella sp.]|uniref:DUF2382 domain-containing protein n=1 Tax=uncultured Sphingosinicella sp. TaxID=478748 RepID=A0A6J4TTW5_9SPHN|nr:YsnF/AvaK domain-containing protein [uncultured Sphingosinicella sp.]CAA9532150.1 MAG: hypothetical protein AVDCRST_MAG23-1056 [uncultured Sphingosinicella sp.]